MKISHERKQTIIMYILEKVVEKKTQLTQYVAKACGINQSTVHSYLNELSESGIIHRIKRGEYELVENEYIYSFYRSMGQIESETKIFNECFKEHIKDLPDNIYRIWDYAFSEMVNNVIDHSAAECLHIIVNCNYLRTMVYISDNGVGIFEKIKNHFGYSTTDDAICELFKGKLTTDAANHSGEGIFFTSRMMDEFLIYSDEKIFTTNKFDEERIIRSQVVNGKGTRVLMSLSNFTKREAREVFDRYADVDGGFTRTKIILKSIFDTDPVSRSQAKRVCNRLENFQEVVLDFEGIEWIGQGFAHQVFVLFAKEHPELKIVPQNMNDAVMKMYNHVMFGADKS